MPEQKKTELLLRDLVAKRTKDYAHHSLTMGVLFGVAAFFCIPIGSGFLYAAFTQTNGFAVLATVFAIAALLFWAIPVPFFIFFYRDLAPYLALKQDKFALVTDQAWYSEPVQKTRKSADGAKEYTVYNTHFKEYGTVGLLTAPQKDQTYYLLILQAPKLRIIDVYPADKYEIVER